MTRILVTGSAGFLGSTLVDRLTAHGDSVVGVDRLATDGVDLATDDLHDVVAGADVVVHLAGQPGVRASWGATFDAYCRDNVLATQRLLEACAARRVGRVVVASSSSVYGACSGAVDEDTPARPLSPYGVSKLAAEQLGGAYARSTGLSVVALRLFTVYGPRQRPDMLVHRAIDAAVSGSRLRVFGDGTQRRDLTYVDDAVAAMVAAATADVAPGTIVNVGGGRPATVHDVIAHAEHATGREVNVVHEPSAAGDPAETHARIDRAAAVLGWEPTTSLAEGVARQATWHAAMRPGVAA